MAPPNATVSLAGSARALPRVGLGAMPLSLEPCPERAVAKRVVQRAVECGVALIDSADVYAPDDGEALGHNERLISEALRDMGIRPADGPDGHGPIVATKSGRTRPGGGWGVDGRPEHLRAACHASLSALGIERIPLYQLHTPDPGVPLEESVGALARLRDEGKVALVGLSNVTPADIERAAAVTPIATVQNPLSAWDTGVRTPPVVRECAQRGMLFLAYAPLGGAARAPQWQEVDDLRRLASDLGATPQELVLRWLLDVAPCVVPIPGATRPERIDSNLRALTLDLDVGARRRLDAVLRSLPGRPSVWRRVAARLSRMAGRS